MEYYQKKNTIDQSIIEAYTGDANNKVFNKGQKGNDRYGGSQTNEQEKVNQY